VTLVARSCRLAVAVAATLLAGCLDPTQVTLEISTNTCDAGYRGTTITVESTESLALSGGAAVAPAAQTPPTCGSDGGIGSLVVIPGPSGDGPFVVIVATGLGVSPELCGSAQPPKGCILERRQLTLLEHRPMVLPIEMLGICEGVFCGDGGTCSHGGCVSDQVGSLCVGTSAGSCTVGLADADAGVHVDAAKAADAGVDATIHDAGRTRDAAIDAGADGAPRDAGELEASGHDSGFDAPAGPCPIGAPVADAGCASKNLACEYGASLAAFCDTVFTCANGAWASQPPEAPSACMPDESACPKEPSLATGACGDASNSICRYLDAGVTCVCLSGASGGWRCDKPAGACPSPRPRLGAPCAPSQIHLQCDYGDCYEGTAEECNDAGVWVQYSRCSQ
jgi:hypothetical protein